jgi:hypothetical protein
MEHAVRCWSAAWLLRVEGDLAVSVHCHGGEAEPFAIALTSRSTIQLARFGRRATAERPDPTTPAQMHLVRVLGDRPAAAPVIVAASVNALLAVGTPLDALSHRLAELECIADALARVYERCGSCAPEPHR